MFGLSIMGVIHTIISIFALGAGLYSVVRHQGIFIGNRVGGKIGDFYLLMTLLTCGTGFCIFTRGGFSVGHALDALVLVALALAVFAHTFATFGRSSRYIEQAAFSFTLLLSIIPAVTEITTRLPVADPLVADPQSKALGVVFAVLFLVFLVATALQLRLMRRRDSRLF